MICQRDRLLPAVDLVQAQMKVDRYEKKRVLLSWTGGQNQDCLAGCQVKKMSKKSEKEKDFSRQKKINRAKMFGDDGTISDRPVRAAAHVIMMIS